MRKPVSALLYLIACTLLIFFGQKFLSARGGSDARTPASRATQAGMAEEAYLSLREVAGVQLGHISITYQVDQADGRCRPRYHNEACPNPATDPGDLQKQLDELQDDLHRRILLLGPCADADGNGYVTAAEGTRLRDLAAFGHLVAWCRANGNVDLARAAGLGEAEAAGRLREYRLMAGRCQGEFPDCSGS